LNDGAPVWASTLGADGVSDCEIEILLIEFMSQAG
jgi:hypothetical protein